MRIAKLANKKNTTPTPKRVPERHFPWAPLALLFVTGAALAAWADHVLLEPSDFITITLLLMAAISVAVTMARRQAKPAKARPVAAERRCWIATKEAFLGLGERMIAQSRRHKQPLSVLVLQLHDLPELRELFGPQVGHELLSKLVNSLHAMAPARSVVVRSDSEVLTVFLPGLHEEAARNAVKRTFGQTIAVESDAREQEIVLVPDFRIQTIADDVASFERLYEEVLENIKADRALEERRQRHLRREHESHCTKPAPLGKTGFTPTAYVRHERTIPVPIGLL